MKLTVIGSGYVGLVTGVCFAEAGNEVCAVDADDAKIATLNAGRCTIYEPGLEDMLRANRKSGRIRFTTDFLDGVSHGSVIFVAVGTPPRQDGSADLSAVEKVFRTLAVLRPGRKLAVIKSTVPVGTAARMRHIFEATRCEMLVASNPEFLREGSAVRDFLEPDRVVIGCQDDMAADRLRHLYEPFVRDASQILVMSSEAAEMAKYASNCYLATRISYVNEIAEICSSLGVDVGEVGRAMGADHRIGSHYLHPGCGYGGSCFPKDVKALISLASREGCQMDLLRAVHGRNERQKGLLGRMVMGRFGNKVAGRSLAVWGLAFKAQTDDVRESPALTVVSELAGAGALLRCHDPMADRAALAECGELPAVEPVSDQYEAAEGADALILCTDWPQYASADFERLRRCLAQPIIFDGRNMLDPDQMLRQRFEYHSVGRPAVKPALSASALPAVHDPPPSEAASRPLWRRGA